MRTLRIVSCLAVGMLAFASLAQAQTPFNCTQQPAGDIIVLQGALLGYPQGDIMDCGNCTHADCAGNDASTCQLSNRVYTNLESACINAELATPIDYIPDAGVFPSNANAYQSDLFTMSNWASDLGTSGKTWILLWDHFANNDNTSSQCTGYYAAQSDVLIFGERGNRRVNPCACTLAICTTSCFNPMLGVTPNNCAPVTGTPVGDLFRIGSTGPVPVPLVAAADPDFAVPGAKISLQWQPACNSRTTDGAVDPLYGYILEAYIDGNGNGLCDPPPSCDADNTGDVWIPFLEISPDPLPPSAGLLHSPGSAGIGGTTAIDVEIVQLELASGIPAGLMECAGFRLRVEYVDDRTSSLGVGGKDGIIDGPITSPPSLPGPLVANQLLAAFISNFRADLVSDKRVDLLWTIGTAGSFSNYQILKAHSPNGKFKEIGQIEGDAVSLSFTFTDDRATGRTAFYRLIASGPGGTEEATFQVDLKADPVTP